MKKHLLIKQISSASLLAIALAGMPAHAQSTGQIAQDTAAGAVDIIVTARRREETAQDVPLSINAVTSEQLRKLNIRDFTEITAVVPGLSLSTNANGQGGTASVRGIAFDANASGFNSTVEFYLNDAPVQSTLLFQSMYDVGQIEVLRGPQGTLRGRASPSGSITVTTHRPDLNEIGGYVSATGTSIGEINANGAINIPVISDMLAVRFAGVVDENEANRVHSIYNGINPYSSTKGGRATVRFQPFDALSIDAGYEKLLRKIVFFDQAESTNIADPTAPASRVTINSDDRLSVSSVPRYNRQEFDRYNLAANLAVGGQRINYVGGYTKQDSLGTTPNDLGAFFGPTYSAAARGAGQTAHTVARQETHELRLSSDERVLGLFDYIVGGFYNRTKTAVDLTQQTGFFSGFAASPAAPFSIINTPIKRNGRSLEKSVFGNLTLHLGDKTEISGGARYIDYASKSNLIISGALQPAANEDVKFHTVIYSGVIKHQFTDDIMAYASVGSSWRPGISVVGDFSLARTPLENQFLLLAPEKSKSYEVGFKSSFLEKRLRFNVSAFHQDFKDYPYRAGGPGIFYVSTDAGRTPGSLVQSVKLFNFVAAVPVKVDGGEVEASFQITPRWSIGATASYARSRIKNASVPCNDYSPRDGSPDSVSTVPTVAQIRAATGGDNLSVCKVGYRASVAPDFSASAQSEFSVPVSGSVDGYLRGLVTFYGANPNDPANAVDSVKAYALANLYLGIRAPNSAWEVSLYGKNITDTDRVLTRTPTSQTASYATFAGGQTGVSAYRGVTYTAPREFGLNVRYAFGVR